MKHITTIIMGALLSINSQAGNYFKVVSDEVFDCEETVHQKAIASLYIKAATTCHLPLEESNRISVIEFSEGRNVRKLWTDDFAKRKSRGALRLVT
jgi:hypothetical protein